VASRLHAKSLVIEAEVEILQFQSFRYFLNEVNRANGLVRDKTATDWPASIAATGFALAAYPVAIERGFISRAAAVELTLATLRFFCNSPHGPEPDATGYQGLYYHFLDMRTGRRAWQCELSTVDSAFLLAGMLTAGRYFDSESAPEHEIRTLADALYRRANWHWAQNQGATLTHGWKPESGFLEYSWQGYDEAVLLYILALGSPTHPLSDGGYAAWSSTYRWQHCYGYDYLYAGSLFTHQLSHLWIDFRGIQDLFMRDKGIDYFENSRRATYVQQQYAIDNPLKFKGYGRCCWGITASDGPGPATMAVDGVERRRSRRAAHKIGLWAVIAIGVGGMVGGGIFAVLGLAVQLAHGGTPVAFALAGVVALLTFRKRSTSLATDTAIVAAALAASGHSRRCHRGRIRRTACKRADIDAFALASISRATSQNDQSCVCWRTYKRVDTA